MHNVPDEQTEPMEGLQPKPRPMPQTPPAASHAPAHHAAGASFQSMAIDADEDDGHTREDAFTVKFAIGKLNEYLQWFLMVLEALLVIRFLLKMFGANPNNLFAGFVFTLTDILLTPFNGIVPPISLHTNQAFEIATLIAMAVYFLLFYALKRFLRILISSPEETE
ncbi:MAG TPA: YggT family protein [Ktedonobacteraceae bacterium]|nr:YggT family protein [Ktedonobacteraceae bacterium]